MRTGLPDGTFVLAPVPVSVHMADATNGVSAGFPVPFPTVSAELAGCGFFIGMGWQNVNAMAAIMKARSSLIRVLIPCGFINSSILLAWEKGGWQFSQNTAQGA